MKYCTVCKAKYDDSVSFCPVDGEVLEDDPSSIVGTVLDGQYQIESMLGKGGMGAVYQARHILLGDRVAIKILPPEVRGNAEWLRRFRREGQAARRFRHPNAVTVYDLRTTNDGIIYMVMEYVEGRTLDAEIKNRGRFTPAEAFETIEPIMSVLNTAHAMGVVHRDLKPENIMMGKANAGRESSVKLLDLGIAKMREIAGSEAGGNTALTMAGQVLGTPYYMSPEQWGELPRDGNPEIDGRADIYSLGLVVYEMVAGKRAYAGMTLHELRKEHVSVPRPPLDSVAPGVPQAFSGAISRAIAKDRADRQPTAGDLSAELRAALTSAGTAADSLKTLPDMPRPEASEAHTAEIHRAAGTKSDVDAPTILTLDSPSTAGPSVPTSQPPIRAEAEAKAGPQGLNGSATLVESAPMGSSLTIPQVLEQPAPKSSRKSMLMVGLGALGLILVVTVVAGYFAFNWFGSRPKSGTAKTNETQAVNGSTVPSTELGRYWLELLPGGSNTGILRVAGVVPLASAQSFKFHFVFTADGYVYIVGPGEGNQLTAFLTAKPPEGSGLETNQVSQGKDFSYPSGSDNWLSLDKNPGTERYTVMFSGTPLSSPGFLSEKATGKPLTEADQNELTDFLVKYKANEPATELDDSNSSLPFVMVKVPGSNTGNDPTVFQIRIQHK